MTRLRFSGLLRAMRERALLWALAIVLFWAIFFRVSDGGYGPGSGFLAAMCAVWGYVILSLYATHLLNARFAGSDSPGGPRGPQAPGGRWPGARP